jgi:hypothetical protein
MSALGRMRVSRRDLSHVLQCVAKCRALEQPGSPLSNWATTFTDRLRKLLGANVPELELELTDEKPPTPKRQ